VQNISVIAQCYDVLFRLFLYISSLTSVDIFMFIFCVKLNVVVLSNEVPHYAGTWMCKRVAPFTSTVAPNECVWSASSPGRFSFREIAIGTRRVGGD